MQAWEEKYFERQEGRVEGIDLFATLTKILLESEKLEELKRATSDKEYRAQLLEEYGLLQEEK